jgi:hypothetical protein
MIDDAATGTGRDPTPEELAVWEAEQQRKADAKEKLRQARNMLLDASDKYATLDYPHHTEEKRKEWFFYRQHLRDLPGMSSPDLDEHGELIGVEWPTPPES